MIPLPAHDGDDRDFDSGVGRSVYLFAHLFNDAHFFEAHEVLEDVWRSVSADEPSQRCLRLHVQGMVQLAVAFHHASTGNRVGARSVLQRAMRNLEGAEDSFPDLDFVQLRAELEEWRRHVAGELPLPKTPRIIINKITRRELFP